MEERSIKFIVNPNANAGKTGKNWEKTYKKIAEKLTVNHGYTFSDGIGEGKRAALEALDEGYERIISVGGEGTAHEIINALYEKNFPDVQLGFIRGGTVNDYLHSLGYPMDLDEQIDIIKGNNIRMAPLVKVEADETRVGLNMFDAGITAYVAYNASVRRKYLWIKGGLRYTVLALHTIAGWKNIPMTIIADEFEYTGDLSAIMAGFSYYDGEYKVTPHADLFGEKMAFVAAFGFSRMGLIKVMGVLKKGEHTEDIKGVYMRKASTITLESDKGILCDLDGEPFSENTDRITIKALPESIPILVPSHHMKDLQ